MDQLVDWGGTTLDAGCPPPQANRMIQSNKASLALNADTVESNLHGFPIARHGFVAYKSLTRANSGKRTPSSQRPVSCGGLSCRLRVKIASCTGSIGTSPSDSSMCLSYWSIGSLGLDPSCAHTSDLREPGRWNSALDVLVFLREHSRECHKFLVPNWATVFRR